MGRTPCCDENSGVKKGPWAPEEDEKLMDYIHKHGCGSWRSLPKRAGLNRCGKSCRLRWNNYLRPDIKRGKFTGEEDEAVINLHSVLGNKWSKIAVHLPGRTDNEIKNYWNTHLRKKLLKRGIDPQTHKPIPDLNLLTNLSQLISASNLTNLMNPWDNHTFSSQANATQLAKIQLFQSIIQLINPLPNITQPQLEFPNLGNNHQSFNNSPAIDNSIEWFEGGFQPEFLYGSSNCLNRNYHTQTENAPLGWAPVESHNVNQIESKINQTNPSIHSPSSTIFEALEKFLDDDDSSGSWLDFLE